MKRVVVIGASTAGLYCAWKLASAGVETWLIDPSSPYRKADRTLILTPVFWNFLPDFPRHQVRHWIEGFQLVHGQTILNVPLAEPDLVIDRADLLNFLYQRVAHLGVHILKQVRFAGIPGPNRIAYRTANTREESIENVTHLVIADGVHSPVSRILGLPRYPSLPILQAKVKPPDGFDSNWSTCWFDPHQTPYFFWYIPHGANEGVLGVVTRANQPIRRLLDDFADFHGFHPTGYQSGRVASFQPRTRTTFKKNNICIYRVGDAAGHVKVTTVGGTVTGLWGAAIIAEKILIGRATRNNGLYQELITHWAIRRILNQFRGRDYEILFRGLGPQLRRFLGEIDRDMIGQNLLKLFRAQPTLFLRFMGYLV